MPWIKLLHPEYFWFFVFFLVKICSIFLQRIKCIVLIFTCTVAKIYFSFDWWKWRFYRSFALIAASFFFQLLFSVLWFALACSMGITFFILYSPFYFLRFICFPLQITTLQLSAQKKYSHGVEQKKKHISLKRDQTVAQMKFCSEIFWI